MAAGKGRTLHNNRTCNTPKQYMHVNGQALIPIAIEKFSNHPQIDAVMVAVNDEHKKCYEEATKIFICFHPLSAAHENKTAFDLDSPS